MGKRDPFTLPNEEPTLETKGDLKLENLSFSDREQRQAKLGKLAWKNETQFRLVKQQPVLNTAGTVELNKVFVDDAQNHLIDLAALTWQGQVGFEGGAKEPIMFWGMWSLKGWMLRIPPRRCRLPNWINYKPSWAFNRHCNSS